MNYLVLCVYLLLKWASIQLAFVGEFRTFAEYSAKTPAELLSDRNKLRPAIIDAKVTASFAE